MLEISIIIAVVMVLTEIIKRKTNMDDKLSGILALILGVGLNVLNAYIFGGDLRQAGMDGFIGAFWASGVFSVVKNTVQFYKKPKEDDDNYPFVK